MKKRLLCLLSSALLTASIAPVMAFASEDASVAVTIDGVAKEITAQIDNGWPDLNLADTSLFAEGENGAYLVTYEDETRLVGNLTLDKWVGSWESWSKYIDVDGSASAEYPYLDEAWKLAYDAYMGAFSKAGIDMSAQMPNPASLKAYWSGLATTKDVAKMVVSENSEGDFSITWLATDGSVLANDTYIMTGKMLKGFEGAPAYVFTAQGTNVPVGYEYFVSMEPGMDGTEETPIAEHYHFQFGRNLDDMLLKGELYNSSDYGVNEKTGRPVSSNLKNSSWYATVIDADASDLAKYNVILGMHTAEKWSALPEKEEESVPDNTEKNEPDVVPAQGSSETPVTPKGKWILNGKWWYKHVDGSYTTNDWELIDGVWYHFDSDGWMRTGWHKAKGVWYYLHPKSGAMQTGWALDNGAWYYLDTATGAMKSGWLLENGNWYYLNKAGEGTYGAMRTGWLLKNAIWYYLQPNGKMATGWQKVNGSWYYFNQNGAMAENTWIGAYHVNANGVWDVTDVSRA